MAQFDPHAFGVSGSEFAMWRAVFAFAFVDNSLSLEEQDVLRSFLKTVPFSQRQIATLRADFVRPPNVEAMYKMITQPEHKKRFCVLARALAWCEGDMNRQETEILRRVSCLRGYPEEGYLRESRGHPDVQNFYQQYAKAGVVGLMRSMPGVQISA